MSFIIKNFVNSIFVLKIYFNYNVNFTYSSNSISKSPKM